MLPSPTSPVSPSLTVQLYRYFFYEWLFRDAAAGGAFEQAAALRHNRSQGKWLPLYMLRWAVLGAVLALLETQVERLTGNSPLAAALTIVLILIALFQFVTALCWAALRSDRLR
jgi:hypothetical protein